MLMGLRIGMDRALWLTGLISGACHKVATLKLMMTVQVEVLFSIQCTIYRVRERRANLIETGIEGLIRKRIYVLGSKHTYKIALTAMRLVKSNINQNISGAQIYRVTITQ